MSNANTAYDYIVVGQGLAGSVLAWFLLKAEKKILIIDELKGETASKQATGLMNPITGRRFAKSWLADDLLPFADKTYTEIEQELGASFFKKTKIHRILQSVEQQNDWASKTQDERYKNYLSNEQLVYKDKNRINNDLGCIEIEPVWKVDTPKLIEELAAFYESKKIVKRVRFEHDKLLISDIEIKYKEFKAKAIIFCEGFNMVNNPLFAKVPLSLTKGEVLHFESKSLQEANILGGSTNIVPIGGHCYSVGASYENGATNLAKTEQKRQELTEKLESIIRCEYKIVDHKAGIRPVLQDRRPIVGAHPEYKNVLIFNGLGSKGLSLSPYFAHQFVQFLDGKASLDSEVKVSRFF